MEKQVDFIKLSLDNLKSMEKTQLPIWEDEFEKNITSGFLFSNVFALEEIKTKTGVHYEMTDLEGLHDIDGYKNVAEFVTTLTGNVDWQEELPYSTYQMELKSDLVNNILEYLDESVSKEFEKEPTKEEEEYIRDYMVRYINSLWNKWSKKSLKDVINKQLNAVWNEDKLLSIQLDIEHLQEKQRVDKFERLMLEWLSFIKRTEIIYLSKKDTKTLSLLQEWIQDKTYEQISLFEDYYPKEKSLAKFRWLDKSLYKSRLAEYKESKKNISNMLKTLKIKTKDIDIPKNILKTYQLRDDIFAIPGKKLVHIDTRNAVFDFYLDEFNRVNGMEQGIIEFNGVLTKTLENVGAIVVRQFSDDTYKSKEDGLEKPYFNIYGALVLQGKYRGLEADELHEMYVINQETGEYLGEEEGTRFFGWNIGDLNDNDLREPEDE